MDWEEIQKNDLLVWPILIRGIRTITSVQLKPTECLGILLRDNTRSEYSLYAISSVSREMGMIWSPGYCQNYLAKFCSSSGETHPVNQCSNCSCQIPMLCIPGWPLTSCLVVPFIEIFVSKRGLDIRWSRWGKGIGLTWKSTWIDILWSPS